MSGNQRNMTNNYAMLTANERADSVRDYARQTNGSAHFYRHPLGMLYTDGAAFVAEICAAHWLLDLIASYQPKLQNAEFQVWTLRPTPKPGIPECWTITADDGGVGGSKPRVIARQVIKYSDFPVELAPFTLWAENRTIMLPEER